MKKLITLFIFLITMNIFAQKEESVVNKENFENLMVQYVKNVADGIKTGTDFIIAEAPEVVKQYLYFTAIDKWIGVLLGLFFMLYFNNYIANLFTKTAIKQPETTSSVFEYIEIKKGKWLYKPKINAASDYVSPQHVGYIVSKYGFILVGLSIICHNIMNAIKVTFFPKLYLVETFINTIM